MSSGSGGRQLLYVGRLILALRLRRALSTTSLLTRTGIKSVSQRCGTSHFKLVSSEIPP